MKSDFFPSLGKTRGQSLSLKSYAATYGNPKSLLPLKNSFEFEKKTLGKGWKLAFGHGLPENVVCASNIVTLKNQRSTFKTTCFLKPQTCKTKPLKLTNQFEQEKFHYKSSLKTAKLNAHFLCARWLLDYLTHEVKKKQNVRGAMNNVLRQASSIVQNPTSGSRLLGLRLVACGRLSRRKKAMSQQISRALGVVPLSSLNAKVDYDFALLTTKLGTIGFKAWLTYA